jgi:SAM-dependent methyltransferase
MRLYDDLAPWFHLLTAPDEYAGEAARYEALALGACPDARTLLELGSGGGNNATHLKRRFKCTLTDLSPAMLALSEGINPECEHLVGDMRSLRLGRAFDVVFVHDAVMYLTTEEDLRACIETAFVHTRPGGVALFAPDSTLEGYVPGASHGGHDGADGRRLRYLEWSHPVHAGANVARVDFAVLLCESDGSIRTVHDAHSFGLFPESTWLQLLGDEGFEALVTHADPDDGDAPQPVFVGVRPPGG